MHPELSWNVKLGQLKGRSESVTYICVGELNLKLRQDSL
jgi:hypothetical protein